MIETHTKTKTLTSPNFIYPNLPNQLARVEFYPDEF